MTSKLIIIVSILTLYSYGSQTGALNPANEASNYPAWNPSITKKISGKTCENGNCISGSKCFTKDGPFLKCITKMKKKIKKHCNDL
ncbi:MAG: hypothetical protein RL113_525 [Pseudomonadota bacterium]